VTAPASAGIHSTAVIDPSAQIAASAVIGPYAVIGPETTVGEGAWVGPHAVVEYARIGAECKIHPHAFIGTPPQDLKYKGEKTFAQIGAKTVIRECVTVNRGTGSGVTVVGENCLIMAYSHIAHDCNIGNNVIMANVATLAGHITVDEGVFIGGISAIHQFTRIGKGAMLAGGSMVAQDVAPFCMTHGNRATLVGLNVVGLRRRGLTREAFSAIKSAYKAAFHSGLTLEAAGAQIDALPQTPEVQAFSDFLKKSSRGLCRPAPDFADTDSAE
jgi:UDP-N-acetylglucosamine acyltransferase